MNEADALDIASTRCGRCDRFGPVVLVAMAIGIASP